MHFARFAYFNTESCGDICAFALLNVCNAAVQIHGAGRLDSYGGNGPEDGSEDDLSSEQRL